MRAETPHRVFHGRQKVRYYRHRLITQQAEVGQSQRGGNAIIRSHNDAAAQRVHGIGGPRHRGRAAANHEQIVAIMGDAAGPCPLLQPGIGDQAHRPRRLVARDHGRQSQAVIRLK